MNKRFKTYVIIWTIFLVLFNAICFVIPAEVVEMSEYSGVFWMGYVFITLAFIGQLICSYIAFKPDNLQKLFYNIPLLKISYIGLIVMLVFGALTMALPNLPNWIGIIGCLLVLAFTAIAVISAIVVGTVVSNIDKKIKTNTTFIKELTVEAQNLTSCAKTPMLKTLCTKVYDALFYSDPMSNEKLFDIENRIKEKFSTFVNAVLSDNSDETESSANELINLIIERNNQVKITK